MSRAPRIGGYEFTRQLSAGNGGTAVYLARSLADQGTRFAIAVASQRDPQPIPAGARAREVARCSSIHHPLIARPIELLSHEGLVAAVYDDPGDISLASLLEALSERGQRLSDACVLHLGRAIASALSEVHTPTEGQGRLPIAHGRVTADVILVKSDGSVRLCGLGLFLFTGTSGLGPSHVAPELLTTQKLLPRADIFAVGTLVRSLLGAPSTEMNAVLAVATAPEVERRRTTAMELQAWFAQEAELPQGQEDLARAMRNLGAPSGPNEIALQSVRSPSLSWTARLLTTAITAVVFVVAGGLFIDLVVLRR